MGSFTVTTHDETTRWADVISKINHPLSAYSHDYHWLKQLDGYHVYKQKNNKSFTAHMALGDLVPHTNVVCFSRQTERPLSTPPWVPHKDHRVNILFWTRKHSRRELHEAIATVHMMNSNPVVLVRSFEPTSKGGWK